MTFELASRDCIPCKGGVPPVIGHYLRALHSQLGSGWTVVGEHHLEKRFALDTYRAGVAFTNAVADIAQEQNHHPDILLVWDSVKITIWTHAIDGLTESDFILAAKVEEAFRKLV